MIPVPPSLMMLATTLAVALGLVALSWILLSFKHLLQRPDADDAAAQLIDFIEVSSDIYWEMGANGELRVVQSRKGLALPNAYVGKPIWAQDNVQPAPGHSWAELQDFIAKRQPFYHFPYMLLSGGRTYHRLASGKPIFDKYGRFKGYRGFARDITADVAAQQAALRLAQKIDAEKRELEEQLHQAEQAEYVGRLIAGFAHEFNNKLQPIIGLSSLMMSECEKTEKNYRNLELIHQAATEANSLIRRLLKVGRGESPEQEKLCNPTDVFEKQLPLLHHAMSPNITFSHTIELQLPKVPLAADELGHILLNLCLNARDACAGFDNAHIDVTVQKVENKANEIAHKGKWCLHLQVKDSGCGMDENQLEHIFKPFYSTKNAQQGSGLGLSVIQDIVKKACGEIIISSKRNAGTTVDIYLPFKN